MKDNDEREGQRRGESKKEKVFFNAWIIYLTRIVLLDKNRREWVIYIYIKAEDIVLLDKNRREYISSFFCHALSKATYSVCHVSVVFFFFFFFFNTSLIN